MKLPSSLLTRKSNFRNDKMLGPLNVRWPSKLFATSGCGKEVAELSWLVFVWGFVDRSSDRSSKEDRVRVFCGVFPLVTSLSHNSVNGNLV